MSFPFSHFRALLAATALLLAMSKLMAEEQVVGALSPVAESAIPEARTTEEARVAPDQKVDEGASEWSHELDVYYSSIGYNIPLTSTPIPTITEESEAAIYSHLISGSLVPRYMLLEASVYPLPWLFTYIKSDLPGLYRDGEIGNSGVNLFESTTAGFQEPWAVSLFLGNMAKLKRSDYQQTTENWGYTGYLASFGAKHIKDNSLVDDNWYELEWKLKGRRESVDETLDWSFRIGAKFNSNREVRNVTYVGLHRSDVDFRYSFLEWLENTNYDLRVHSLQDGGKIVRVELIGGKNLPVKQWRVVSTLDLGVVWTSPDEYAGALRDRRSDKLTLVLRPSLSF